MIQRTDTAAHTDASPMSSEAAFPSQVIRPLRRGAWAVFLALGGFCLWAGFAPLATSIPTTGHLNAARPSYDVQHPYGGKIAQIHVSAHDVVTAGQILLQLDVSRETAEAQALRETLSPLQEERAVLRAAMVGALPDGEETDATAVTDPAALALRRLQTMKATMELRAEMSTALAQELKDRAERLQKSRQHRQAQHHSMQARYERYAALQAQGAFRAADTDALAEDILELEADLQREDAELAGLASQAAQAKLQIAQDQLAFRQQVLDRLAYLEEAIPKLRLQLLRLEAQIAQADIPAPDDGVISALYYDTDAMVIARGDTVLSLARPSGQHQVSFVANPQVIDQLRVGMTGQLTVTALSQRSHPKVAVTIKTLSPEARRDRDGAILGYDGMAEIDVQDHARLLNALGEEASLISDMPVSLVFTGRTITFGAYLLGPFTDFLTKAMQD
ncbi:HlyD family efflux transporter periplasmic adaptor subunit [Shimia sp. R11_0]|uniref:biotin/lipoyl-binding protein n=1 Tax=Shimia sp. R11_0 TaxID=2821096 RepID=UPI001ADC7E8C|nr:biotin/lipoyl-binding protein [Shimia sp. R11_0]MBO9477769.1 HlyD family efflux transporter periplasmic adaptor subunit [Shimia sp. R11_0]